MDPDETGWIESGFNPGHGDAQGIVVPAHPQVHVVARGLQPLDVTGRNQEFLAQLAHQEALRTIDGLERQAFVGNIQQSGLALQSQQQEPIKADREQYSRVGLAVLQELIPELTWPRPEMVFTTHARIGKFAKPDHGHHMHHRKHDRRRDMPGQIATQRAEVDRKPSLKGDHRGHQRQQDQVARPLPDHRLPSFEAEVGPAHVQVHDHTVHHGGKQEVQHPEADLEPPSPGQVAVQPVSGGVVGRVGHRAF